MHLKNVFEIVITQWSLLRKGKITFLHMLFSRKWCHIICFVYWYLNTLGLLILPSSSSYLIPPWIEWIDVLYLVLMWSIMIFLFRSATLSGTNEKLKYKSKQHTSKHTSVLSDTSADTFIQSDLWNLSDKNRSMAVRCHKRMTKCSIKLSQNLKTVWNSKIRNTTQYMIPQCSWILDSEWSEGVD